MARSALAWPALRAAPCTSSRISLGSFQQAQGVCHGAAGFAHALGDVLLCHLKPLHELFVALRLFQRIQVLPLEVLDEGNFHGLLVGNFPDDDGDFVQPQHPCRTPAAFAGDDLVVQPVGRTRMGWSMP